MCIHCCRLRQMPCPAIPYACPLCSVHEIASGCPELRKPYSEHKWFMVRKKQKYEYPSPCNTRLPRWLDFNRQLIFTLAKKLKRSPEAIQYMLIRLLHANYGQVMQIMKRRHSYQVPYAGLGCIDNSGESNWSFSNRSLFNEQGELSSPMDPEMPIKLFRLIQDYLVCLRQLNRKYKWFKHGQDNGDLMGLLGEQDELLKLLVGLFGGSDLISIQNLLQVLFDVDLNNLFNKNKKVQSHLESLEGISNLYSEVAAVEESPMSTPPESASNMEEHHSTGHSRRSSENQRNSTSATSSTSGSMQSLYEKTYKNAKNRKGRKYLAAERPMLFHEPFDPEKSWTWMTRHPQQQRVLPNSKIGKGQVRRYHGMSEQRKLDRLRERYSLLSEKSDDEDNFMPMFGHKSGRSRLEIKQSSRFLKRQTIDASKHATT